MTTFYAYRTSRYTVENTSFNTTFAILTFPGVNPGIVLDFFFARRKSIIPSLYEKARSYHRVLSLARNGTSRSRLAEDIFPSVHKNGEFRARVASTGSLFPRGNARNFCRWIEDNGRRAKRVTRRLSAWRR